MESAPALDPPWNQRAPPPELARRDTQAEHSIEVSVQPGYDIDDDIDYVVGPDAPWPED